MTAFIKFRRINKCGSLRGCRVPSKALFTAKQLTLFGSFPKKEKKRILPQSIALPILATSDSGMNTPRKKGKNTSLRSFSSAIEKYLRILWDSQKIYSSVRNYRRNLQMSATFGRSRNVIGILFLSRIFKRHVCFFLRKIASRI